VLEWLQGGKDVRFGDWSIAEVDWLNENHVSALGGSTLGVGSLYLSVTYAQECRCCLRGTARLRLGSACLARALSEGHADPHMLSTYTHTHTHHPLPCIAAGCQAGGVPGPPIGSEERPTEPPLFPLPTRSC
jgi:hypothetical protein